MVLFFAFITRSGASILNLQGQKRKCCGSRFSFSKGAGEKANTVNRLKTPIVFCFCAWVQCDLYSVPLPNDEQSKNEPVRNGRQGHIRGLIMREK